MDTLIILLTLLVFATHIGTAKHTLYVGGLMEMSNNWYAKYCNSFIHILEYVFDQIENRTDILVDYSLTLLTKDTQVNM